MTTERPYFYFTDNPHRPAEPVFNLELYHSGEGTYYDYQMSFRETLAFCAGLSREVARIALKSPALRRQTLIRDVDCHTNSYKPTRGLLARILGRE
jgi:hypothetical protein